VASVASQKGLKLITWNIGGFMAHHPDLYGCLALHSPHLVFLQEAKLSRGSVSAVNSTLHDMGYHCLAGTNNLVIVHRLGINVAPIASSPGDDGHRVQRLALQIGQQRILLRHRHGHSNSPAQRALLNTSMQSESVGNLVLDIGDFNESPSGDHWPGSHILFPCDRTYRHNGYSEQWISTIDGAIASDGLAASSSVRALDPVLGAQHRPVLVEIGFQPSFHDSYQWCVSDAVDMGPWSDHDKLQFQSLIDSGDYDRAWSFWASNSGSGVSSIRTSSLWGGWTIGAHFGELAGLWKTLRRQYSDARYDAAKTTLESITSLINEANQVRLSAWNLAMQKRGAAARWVKRKLDSLAMPKLPEFGAVLFSPSDIARRVGATLAQRWNGDLYRLDRHAPMGYQFGDTPGLAPLEGVPRVPIQRPAIDLSLFDHLPVYQAPGKWQLEEIFQFMPSGNPGLDGQSVDWLSGLHHDSLCALLALLDLADGGHFPSYWKHARVTLIPKGEDSAPDDRRPLTVLAVTYRLWAKRHSASLNKWLEAAKPKGLSGAVAGVSCPDILWEIQNSLGKARTGADAAAFLLSMDQEKCFDRLDIENLRAVAIKLEMEALQHALNLYEQITRLLFVDNQPSDVWIQGSGLVGIPQGCPLACLFCNLTAIAWHVTCERAAPGSKTYSYLDDRFALCPSWRELNTLLVATQHLDLALGPSLNLGKTHRGVAYRHGGHRPALPRDLSVQPLGAIGLVNSFKYLGVDIQLSPSAARPTAISRHRRLCNRCGIVKSLPRHQRGIGIADAVAGLWLSGGTILSKAQFTSSVTAGFEALIGRTRASAVLRSRGVTHVVGPGAHYTHVPCATVYAVIHQWLRMLLSRRMCPGDWEHLYGNARLLCGGPVRQFVGALSWLGVDWDNPTTLSFGGRRLDFSITRADLALGDDSVRVKMHKGRCAEILHDARDFLRFTLLAGEAARRPKHFSGLEAGWDESRQIREATHSLLLCSGGPALVAGGLWTQLNISRTEATVSDICVRCGLCVETNMHRLWHCAANSDMRRDLDVIVGVNNFPDSLPACLSRCGLVPRGFLASSSHTVDHVLAIHDYLVKVNQVACKASADARHGRSVQLSLPAIKRLDKSEIFRYALPPIKRAPKVGASNRPDFPQQEVEPRLPAQPLVADWASSNRITVSVDGSCSGTDAGWGFTVAIQGESSLRDFCGPIITCNSHVDYLGATHHSNNVGELTAALLGLAWVSSFAQPFETIVFEFDSDYAASAIRRLTRPRSNIQLILRARALLDSLSQTIQWTKVTSHTDQFLNERADALAKCGAHGILRGMARLHTTPAFSVLG